MVYEGKLGCYAKKLAKKLFVPYLIGVKAKKLITKILVFSFGAWALDLSPSSPRLNVPGVTQFNVLSFSDPHTN